MYEVKKKTFIYYFLNCSAFLQQVKLMHNPWIREGRIHSQKSAPTLSLSAGTGDLLVYTVVSSVLEDLLVYTVVNTHLVLEVQLNCRRG